MHLGHPTCNRRAFIKWGATLTAGLPLAQLLGAERQMLADATPEPSAPLSVPNPAAAKVAIASCRSYGSEVTEAFKQSFDRLGGIGSLVQHKTVTVKINLTGTNFRKVFKRPTGESYMTHSATVMALGTLLFAAGAKRMRLVESTNNREPLEKTLVRAGWDVNALLALGAVEMENTRNLGKGKSYAHLAVPNEGYLYSSFDLNHVYDDTDVFISLAKLKNHATAGVTLTMKNLFGITPNALYGDGAVSEEATAGRGRLHDPASHKHRSGPTPGEKKTDQLSDDTSRIPRIVADLCAARPIHLALIDGITSMRGSEGPWCEDYGFIAPGIVVAGFNAVSTDAVGTAVMGYANPRAQRGVGPFKKCDNHLLLAEQTGLGTADLAKIEVLGVPIEKARCPYDA